MTTARLKALSATAWLCGGLLLPGAALALGLGEARVNSYLNQPLDAHIHLIDADAAALDSLAVRPGGADDYRRVGLDLNVLQTPLNVTVDRSVSPPVVRVTSDRPITDPVLQILVYARWSSGRVLREYTLFLDPPLIDVAPAVARSEPPPEGASPPRHPAPAAEPAVREMPRPAVPVIRGDGHLVQAGDTLWSIAYQWRPDSSLNMNQVLLAFQQLNPHAFVNGNVNHMQRGVELKFPGAEDVRALDVRRAEREIQAQMQAWHSRPAHEIPVFSDAAVEVAERARPLEPEDAAPRAGDAAADTGARLSLVPPDASSEAEGDPLGDPEAQAELRRLRGVLAQAEEELAAHSFEHRDTGSQIAALREGIEAREGGLGITDSELADLEDALRSARLEAAEQAALARRETPDQVLAAYFGELESGLGIGPANSESNPGSGRTSANGEAARAQDEVPEMRAADPPREEPMPADDPVLRWVIWAVIALALTGTLAAMILIGRRRQPKPLALKDMEKELARPEPPQKNDDTDNEPAEDDETALMRILSKENGNGTEEDDRPDRAETGETGDDIFTLDESEAGVKLDLAQAYLSMGDRAAARTLLDEVAEEGNPEQRERARRMLEAL